MSPRPDWQNALETRANDLSHARNDPYKSPKNPKSSSSRRCVNCENVVSSPNRLTHCLCGGKYVASPFEVQAGSWYSHSKIDNVYVTKSNIVKDKSYILLESYSACHSSTSIVQISS